MNFLSYKLCKLFVCLMCFQMSVNCEGFPMFRFVKIRPKQILYEIWGPRGCENVTCGGLGCGYMSL
jgi:hypothetical protein